MTAFISEFTLSADPAAQGPTIAIKDSIDVAGYPTTGASRSLADAPPAAAHAEVVQRLLDAGWRITGKTIGSRSETRRCRARHRHGRLDSRTGCMLRRDRTQADVRARVTQRRRAA